MVWYHGTNIMVRTRVPWESVASDRNVRTIVYVWCRYIPLVPWYSRTYSSTYTCRYSSIRVRTGTYTCTYVPWYVRTYVVRTYYHGMPYHGTYVRTRVRTNINIISKTYTVYHGTYSSTMVHVRTYVRTLVWPYHVPRYVFEIMLPGTRVPWYTCTTMVRTRVHYE